MPAFLLLFLAASLLFHTPSAQLGIMYDGNSIYIYIYIYIYVVHRSVCACISGLRCSLT